MQLWFFLKTIDNSINKKVRSATNQKKLRICIQYYLKLQFNTRSNNKNDNIALVAKQKNHELTQIELSSKCSVKKIKVS